MPLQQTPRPLTSSLPPCPPPLPTSTPSTPSTHLIQITLNVGGFKFSTTVTTLRNAPDPSLFSAMFSGRHALRKDDQGCVFIDRWVQGGGGRGGEEGGACSSTGGGRAVWVCVSV